MSACIQNEIIEQIMTENESFNPNVSKIYDLCVEFAKSTSPVSPKSKSYSEIIEFVVNDLMTGLHWTRDESNNWVRF